MEPMTSSRLARAAGVHQQTIRYYERRGLIPEPPRTGAGYRQYPAETLTRVRFIKQAQALGFTLREIRALLALRIRPGVDCADIRERTRQKVSEIQQKIEALQRMETALTTLVRRCRGKGPVEECPILGAMDDGLANA